VTNEQLLVEVAKVASSTDGRPCFSHAASCTGFQPCDACEGMFFLSVVEPSMIAAQMDQEQVLKFTGIYSSLLQAWRAEVARVRGAGKLASGPEASAEAIAQVVNGAKPSKSQPKKPESSSPAPTPEKV